MTAGKRESSPMVTATIDGVQVTVPQGTLIIRAAESIGIEIPRFCDHPLLEPAGACRQCLVEVSEPGPDGKPRPLPKPQTSCSLELREGMVVRTQETSAVAERAQRGIMELLLINHPLDCPVCDKGGECPLQDQAMTHGGVDSEYTDVKRTFDKPLLLSTAILLDRERCILCQRCTRFSDQISGDPFIELQERGAGSQIGTFDTDVLKYAGDAPASLETEDESGRPFSSYFSGNTIQICPVGALTSTGYRFRSRPFDLVSSPSIAEHDSSCSAIRVDHRRGVVLRRLAGNDPDVNEEWITDKDRFAFQWSSLDDRITSPFVRDEDGLREATWPEALARAAEGLGNAVEGSKAKGVGVIPGGRVTLEDAYAYQKFARVVLGTNDVDARVRVSSDEEQSFLGHAVAGSGLGVTFADLEAAPTVALVGFEPEDEGGVVFLRLRKALGRQRVYAFAPFLSPGNVKLDATHVPTVPGLEGVAADRVRKGSSGLEGRIFEDLKRDGSVMIVGERLAGVPGALSAVLDLAERTGAGMVWIPRRVGERGAVEAGALPGLLPGGLSVESEEARGRIARLWGVSDLPVDAGRSVYDLLDLAGNGKLSALVVGGVTLADLPRPQANGIKKAPFLVSLEVRRSDVTDLADVVLPVAPPSEKKGTFVNWEGRPRPFDPALSTGIPSDHRVLDMLSGVMGVDLGTSTAEAVTTELERIEPDDSLRLSPPSVVRPTRADITRRSGEVRLATWHALVDLGSLQEGEPHLAGTARIPVARVSPASAEVWGLKGRVVKVSGSGRGRVSLPLVITPGMVDEVIWLPSNSPGSAIARTLAVGHGDPVSVKGSGS